MFKSFTLMAAAAAAIILASLRGRVACDDPATVQLAYHCVTPLNIPVNTIYCVILYHL